MTDTTFISGNARFAGQLKRGLIVCRRGAYPAALRELSLRMEAGVLGLVGPNGAGKTTLLKMLATLLLLPTEGHITWNGQDMLRKSAAPPGNPDQSHSGRSVSALPGRNGASGGGRGFRFSRTGLSSVSRRLGTCAARHKRFPSLCLVPLASPYAPAPTKVGVLKTSLHSKR